MAKEKLFTPEDFDKPSGGKNKGLKIALCIVAGIIIIGLAGWAIWSFSNKKEESKEPQPTEDVATGQALIEAQDSVATDVEVTTEEETPVPVYESEASDAETTHTTPTKAISASSIVSDDIDSEAMKVIRGDYGNVPERKELLGNKFHAIQSKVNQLKKDGVF